MGYIYSFVLMKNKIQVLNMEVFRMTVYKKVCSKEMLMGKLSHGADLYDELTKICKDENISLGRVEALGAVKNARVGFYNQETREYEYHTFNEDLEITKLVGNISIKGGEPIIHAHITLSDTKGKAFGGHLTSGTEVFACEFIIEEFEGPVFERGFDEETSLPLWSM